MKAASTGFSPLSAGSVWRDYAVVAVATLLALGVRFALDPFLNNHLPYVTFFVAVAAVAWYSPRLAPAIVAVALGALASHWFFVPPRSSFRIESIANSAGLGTYFIVTLSFVAFGHALHRSRYRAHLSARQLDTERENLRSTLASIGDAVIACDASGRVTYLNSVAENITGWALNEATGLPIANVLQLANEETHERMDCPANRVLREGRFRSPDNRSLLISRDGAEHPVDESAAPIRDAAGQLTGVIVIVRDASARRRAEQEIRESEARFRNMADNAPVMVWVTEPDGSCSFLSKTWYEFTGQTPETGLGVGWVQVIHPDDQNRVHDSFVAANTEHATFRSEYRLRRKDGSYRWAMDAAAPRFSDKAEFLGYVGSVIDITERKLAEETLRSTQQELAEDLAGMMALQDVAIHFVREDDFHALADAIVDAAISITHADMGNLQLCVAGQETLSIVAHRGLPKAWLDFFSEVDANARTVCGAAKAAGRRVVVPDVTVAPVFAGTPAIRVQLDAGIRAVQSTPIFSRSGEWLGMLSTHFKSVHCPSDRELQRLDLLVRQAADFLERRKLIDRLEQQRRLYDTILSNTPDLVYVFDRNHRFIYANNALLTMWGKTWEEAVGRNCLELGYEPWHAEMHDREIKQVIATKRPVRGEVPFTGAQGHRIYDYIFVPVIGASGDVEAIAGTTRDVTELRQHAALLEERVQERTDSLNQTVKSMETLLYTIAHDLRAPNRAMSGYAQIISENYGDKFDDEGRFLLDRISRAALKNDRLIRDLLEFGRLAQADFPCHGVDPRPGINAVLSGFHDQIRETGASVEVAHEWPKVWGNDSALSHALTNLISNALKYVAPGVKPNIRIYPKPVKDSSESSQPSRLRICVEDNGIGVPVEQQQRIFGPFQRAVTEGYEGTGMGLAIVQKAAERMRGTTGVHSAPAGGSCFWIELPSEAPLHHS